MAGGLDLERIRGFVEGTLPPAERAAFERELERDPALAELVDAFALARDDAVPAPATRFEDLALAGPRPWRRRLVVLAAAAVVVVGLGVAWSLRPDPDDAAPPAVALRAIPLRPLLTPPEPPPLPAGLAEHRTADGDGLLWLDDLDIARAVATFARRPILLFIDFAGCPLCEQYERGPFRDARVARAGEAFVLVRLSWQEAPERLRADPRQGWPLFDALDEAGARIGGFKGYRDAERLAAWLERAAQRFRDRFATPDWAQVRAHTRALDEAAASDRAAVRYERWTAVARADGDGPFGAVARAHLARMRDEARTALLDARDRGGPLAAAAKRFQGTPYGDDLRRVADHVDRYGAVPRLEEEEP